MIWLVGRLLNPPRQPQSVALRGASWEYPPLDRAQRYPPTAFPSRSVGLVAGPIRSLRPCFDARFARMERRLGSRVISLVPDHTRLTGREPLARALAYNGL